MATGAKLMKEISDQFLICKICLQPFQEPKTLSCLHTFCCACVQQQYDAETNRPTRYTLYTRSVTCPLCRKKTDLPTGGVRRLQDNFLVSNLTDVLAKRCVSKVPPCEICHTVRQRTNDASSKCLDCDKLLCRSCVDLHSTTKVTQGHSLIDVEGQKDIECKTHPEETVRFYCERCEECICVVCTFQEHKDHDVCSFGDGFAKYRAGLENLLCQSKQRLSGMASRLQAIGKFERQSKELKERIRDMAISYTAQVRAREKELIKKVDEVMGGEVLTRLAESKSWLQETFDSLQSACNLTEIVMKDKGVEMLLLKKEIQGKMDTLLAGPLPPDLPDLHQLDVKFVPGEVQLGDVCLPGEHEKDEKGRTSGRDKDGGQIVENGLSHQPSPPLCSALNGADACKDCAERKRKEAEEEKNRAERGTKDDGRTVSTKSVYIQTKSQESADAENDGDGDGGRGRRRNGHFSTTSSQATSVVSTASTSTTTTVTSQDAGTDICDENNKRSWRQRQRRQSAEEAVPRGTMTERLDVRSLKTQTEESCLRDTHLGQAAAMGSSYPNTGGAIAAAFLRHSRASDDDLVMTRSGSSTLHASHSPSRLAQPDTSNAEAATELSLGVSDTWSDVADALRRAGWEGEGKNDGGRPDLLAQTAGGSSNSSSPWIRSRRVQTQISALRGNVGVSAGDKFVTDEELQKYLFGPVARPPETNRRDSASSPLFHRPRAARQTQPSEFTVETRDAASMTSFKVTIAPDAVADKETCVEPVASRGVAVMTSPETRTVYIQTKGARVTSTATGTDHEGRMSKSTSTLHVTTSDAETAMPRVTHETRHTWTESVATSERTTCTDSPPTSDAATLTTKTKTGEFGVQMKPIGVAAATNTVGPRVSHRPSQTCRPGVSDRGTMPDPALPVQSVSPSPSSSTLSLDQATPVSLPVLLPPLIVSASPGNLSTNLLAAASGAAGTVAVTKADKAVETTRTKITTRAVGPNSQMQSSRTIATDTLHLTQVTDKETATPTIKTVDDWTLTPQPQVISTGVTPPRPAYLEVGVATTPIVSMDQATYTEVVTTRESGTESYLVVCDSETLTDRTQQCDAQTEAEVRPNTETVGTSMDEEMKEGEETQKEEERIGGQREDGGGPHPLPSPECAESACQCSRPELLNKEVNTTRLRRKAKEVQTSYSYVECQRCQHPESAGPAKTFTDTSTEPSPGKTFIDNSTDPSPGKTFTDTSTDPSPRDTHDVGTMALSCLASPPGGLADFGVQTSEVSLYDRCVATSFEFDDDFLPLPPPRPFLGLECQDAATSTESLPYIGLLSEIDVDELIVFPEAHFELVGDDYGDCEYDPVLMVDDETWMESLDYAEVGTQTLLPVAVGGQSGDRVDEGSMELVVRPEDDCSKCLVSIGVNTTPKATFEKETSTPIRHLFSKGTMTFYVAKMDKATSTISSTRALAEGRLGAGTGGERVVREARRRTVEHKVTMTSTTDQKDIAVETDPTLVDGRITECISKLRNVSQRLNSPTARKTQDGDLFFPHSFNTSQAGGGNKLQTTAGSSPPASSSSSPKSPASPPGVTNETKDLNATCPPPPPQSRTKAGEEEQRQRQLHNLLVETDAVLRAKDVSPVRKAQPITTLKPRTPVTPGEGYASKSLPRDHSLDRHNKVKMGSQATPPTAATRMPLLRYNSAPGRIATVPAKTLLLKAGQAPTTTSSSPRTSPSRIPVSQTKAPTTLPVPNVPAAATAAATGGAVSSDTGPEPEALALSPSGQKVQARPSLPSISETRTPSSCSESSFVSMESAAAASSSLDPASADAFSHSRTPSNVTAASDTAGSDVTQTGHSLETASTDGDDSSVSSASVSLAVPAAEAPGSRSPSPGATPKKGKKEKKGFMQRLLSGGRKKPKDNSEKDNAASKLTIDSGHSKQQQLQPPSSPQVQPKTQAGAKPKPSPKLPRARPKSKATKASPPQTDAVDAAPPSHPPPSVQSVVSDASDSKPTSASNDAEPARTGGDAGLPAAAAAAGSAQAAATPLPPHHYPPLPDATKTPPPPRKPQPFVIVQHRIMSIQQDNVEELKEKKEREKEGKKGKEEKEKEEPPKEKNEEEKEKGKLWGKDRVKVGVKGDEKAKVRGKEKAALLCRSKAGARGGKETKEPSVPPEKGKGERAVKKVAKGNETKESAGVVDRGKGTAAAKRMEKTKESKVEREGRKTRDRACKQ